MKLEEIIKNSNLHIGKDRILFNEPMKKHSTFKIGGPAECLIKVENKEELKEILNLVNKNNMPLTILGNGSNILVLDKGIPGITVIIKIEGIEILEENGHIKIIVGAGEKIAKLGRIFLQKEITGFEEISGIPGTIGGAVRMNAGAHGKEMKDIVKKVKCLDYNGNEKVFSNEEMEFSYRKSKLKKEKYIVTEVELELQKGNKEEINKEMEEYKEYRKEKQPIEFPSAGSTFKRGEDFITAKLIEEAGLKGYSIGDAEVSTKHSGFIINKGNATANDVLQLIEYVKEKVYKKFQKKIELEIEIIGKEG